MGFPSLHGLWTYPKKFYFSFYSLTYNAFRSDTPLFDCAFEPIIWIVDHFADVLGRVLVVLVTFLISLVVVVFYIYALPVVLEYDSTVFATCHLICGHWLLLNISFHYYKAVTTNPGHPPVGRKVIGIKNFEVCTKCIQLKPRRTHHCSVCNRCVLKMDHHCPWINNCVGHFNHRYFFLFCVYMCLGTIYVSLTTFPKFLEDVDIHAKSFFQEFTDAAKSANKYKKHDSTVSQEVVATKPHSYILFEFVLCSCVTVAVGGLASWHAYIISRGETSIERYANKKQQIKMKKEGLVRSFFSQ